MSTNHPHIEELLHLWIQGDLSDEEFQAKIGARDFAKYQQILQEVDRWTPAVDEETFDPREIISPKPIAKSRRLWPIVSVAASVALLIGALYLLMPKGTSYHTGYGEKRNISLPDGSQVVLASHSTLSWADENWTEDSRRVQLVGKAFFDVEPGSPFSVWTSEGYVEVLGTEFDVQSYSLGMQVVCYEGQVRATHGEADSKIISAGESSLWVDGEWEETKEVTDDKPVWINGNPAFRNTPLRLVIQEMEALFGIKIVVGEVDLNRRFTGSIPQDSLAVSLKIVFDTMGIKYSQKGQEVFLSKD
ncbi:FecR family protein [Reichenbachiella sp. 5M10]|uniref:FecR family protein n=1 Tax=Reichenbachiella sp. 5M10 TaxID=1889772 RepID=UPI00117B8E67|nr:FecR domain-containing protein [Reichenbachiella sp. 5M10]